MNTQQTQVAVEDSNGRHHDVAVGMLEGYIERMSDPECSALAVRASANTALLIFRTLSIISASEDLTYTERLNRKYAIRQGRSE
ncbi:hypothetical protein ACIOZM_08400 [Pseudomonas sp. NPDC087346]|uniref:hypothetical protein n=1 Tax=Pseudomonas sp. NPDC087346 TaxID=3364438 RepID=UPI003816F157